MILLFRLIVRIQLSLHMHRKIVLLGSRRSFQSAPENKRASFAAKLLSEERAPSLLRSFYRGDSIEFLGRETFVTVAELVQVSTVKKTEKRWSAFFRQNLAAKAGALIFGSRLKDAARAQKHNHGCMLKATTECGQSTENKYHCRS